MQLFYSTDIQKKHIYFDEVESRHISKVLRKSVGDTLWVTDGKGNLFESRIMMLGKKVESEIVAKQIHEKGNLKLHIAISPTKNLDRMEWMVEKLTEIGVDRISFVRCSHSERKVLKIERLKKKALSAMKQSQRVYLPEISELENYKEFIAQNEADFCFIAHCEDSDRKSGFENNTNGEILVLIGPEGDFTPEEIKLANDNGYKELDLGKYILRTETAAMVVCSQLNHMNQGRANTNYSMH